MIVLHIFMNAEEMGRQFKAGTRVIEAKKELSVGLLNAGLQSGKPSVSFMFELPDDSVETSLASFVSAARVFAAKTEEQAVTFTFPDYSQALAKTGLALFVSASEAFTAYRRGLHDATESKHLDQSFAGDPDIQRWIYGIVHGEPAPAGDFLQSLAEAVVRADATSYAALRDGVKALMQRFPKYYCRCVDPDKVHG